MTYLLLHLNKNCKAQIRSRSDEGQGQGGQGQGRSNSVLRTGPGCTIFLVLGCQMDIGCVSKSEWLRVVSEEVQGGLQESFLPTY